MVLRDYIYVQALSLIKCDADKSLVAQNQERRHGTCVKS